MSVVTEQGEEVNRTVRIEAIERHRNDISKKQDSNGAVELVKLLVVSYKRHARNNETCAMASMGIN